MLSGAEALRAFILGALTLVEAPDAPVVAPDTLEAIREKRSLSKGTRRADIVTAGMFVGGDMHGHICSLSSACWLLVANTVTDITDGARRCQSFDSLKLLKGLSPTITTLNQLRDHHLNHLLVAEVYQACSVIDPGSIFQATIVSSNDGTKRLRVCPRVSPFARVGPTGDLQHVGPSYGDVNVAPYACGLMEHRRVIVKDACLLALLSGAATAISPAHWHASIPTYFDACHEPIT